MSFYTDSRPGIFPGNTNNPLNGLCERIAVQVTKVFDACMYQAQLENYRLTATNFNPTNPAFPLTYISAYSTNAPAQVSNLVITRFDDRPNFARVQADVNVPVIVTYTDANGVAGTATATVTLSQDVIMYVPQPSIVPINVVAFANISSTIGSSAGEDGVFTVTLCVTLILKVVADVDVIIPSYGYTAIPPCTPFTGDEVCPGMFEMPLFPTAVAPQSSNPNNNR
ncbi:MAG: hypothetical protein J6Q15_01300 [Clostridia bacterium]|nr:hypothetical protein [Clostridia bacterium]